MCNSRVTCVRLTSDRLASELCTITINVQSQVHNHRVKEHIQRTYDRLHAAASAITGSVVRVPAQIVRGVALKSKLGANIFEAQLFPILLPSAYARGDIVHACVHV